jgi:putative nucleotidyltransferase with HDIG domain
VTGNIETVRERVQHLFNEQDRQHAGFPWMYENHIRLVEEEADGLMDEYDADGEVVRLAALLHDIGYIEDHKNHEEVGFRKAQEVLADVGIELSEERLGILDEAITEHGYSGSPKRLEARIIASADALSHLRPRFWVANAMKDDESLAEFYGWMGQKIEKDLNKICIEEARKKALERISSYSPRFRPQN